MLRNWFGQVFATALRNTWDHSNQSPDHFVVIVPSVHKTNLILGSHLIVAACWHAWLHASKEGNQNMLLYNSKLTVWCHNKAHSYQIRRIIIVYCGTQRNRVATPTLGRNHSPHCNALSNVCGIEEEEIASRSDECAALILLFSWPHETRLPSAPHLIFLTVAKILHSLQSRSLSGQSDSHFRANTFLTPMHSPF